MNKSLILFLALCLVLLALLVTITAESFPISLDTAANGRSDTNYLGGLLQWP